MNGVSAPTFALQAHIDPYISMRTLGKPVKHARSFCPAEVIQISRVMKHTSSPTPPEGRGKGLTGRRSWTLPALLRFDTLWIYVRIPPIVSLHKEGRREAPSARDKHLRSLDKGRVRRKTPLKEFLYRRNRVCAEEVRMRLVCHFT